MKARPHCCEEASVFTTGDYAPCNRPATSVIRWKGRSDPPIRMCEACAWHNVRNRGGVVVSVYHAGPAAGS